MINFYVYHNGTLDNQHYSPLIDQAVKYTVTCELKLIEHIIKKSPTHAYQYAYIIKKGRWVEAEPIIRKYPWYAYNYARNIMKCRWIEAEDVIRQDDRCWKCYCRKFGI